MVVGGCIKTFTVLIYFFASSKFVSSFIAAWNQRRPHASTWVRATALNTPFDSPESIEPCEFTGTGCVLLAQPGEFDHFLSSAAVLIYEHNSERGTQGVILEKPTAFTMGETSPNIGVFEANPLFMGGQDGIDMATMFHKYELSGFSKSIGGGIYVGGLGAARELVESRKAVPKDFKFVFNSVQWAPGLLEKEISQKRWDVCRVPADLILSQDLRTGSSLWYTARKALNKLNALHKPLMNEEET